MKRAVVIGTAPGFEADYKNLEILLPARLLKVAVGRAFKKVPCDVAYSWRQDLAEEAFRELSVPVFCVSDDNEVGLNVFTPRTMGGSSGLSAILLATDFFGCSKVVTVGCRMDGDYERFRPDWTFPEVADLKNKVRGYRDFGEEAFGPFSTDWFFSEE